MDQDYERRLLRQIVIQNENTMPCVSNRLSSQCWPGLVELVGSWGEGYDLPQGFSPQQKRKVLCS